jgi:hypothetical protein
MARHENRKIRYENELLKANEPAPLTSKLFNKIIKMPSNSHETIALTKSKKGEKFSRETVECEGSVVR